MSRSWVSLARRSDPDFDARCRAAKAASAERLGASGCNRPPRAWSRRGGVGLVVQRAGKRPPQVVRRFRARWTWQAEERFLAKLRRCNNLRMACEWAGMTLSSYEAHWRRWPDFRMRVSEARAAAGRWLDIALEAQGEETPDFTVTEAMEAEAPLACRIRLARRHKRSR